MANQVNVQDTFLNYVRKNKVPVTIFLLNGVKLTGTISCFDRHCIILKRETYVQFVYKHAISTFSPHGNIPMLDWSECVQRDQRQDGKDNEGGACGTDGEEYAYDYVYDGDE